VPLQRTIAQLWGPWPGWDPFSLMAVFRYRFLANAWLHVSPPRPGTPSRWPASWGTTGARQIR